MGLFDENDGSVRAQTPNTEVVTGGLPKLVVSAGSEGVPSLKVTPSAYRYTKEELTQHPLSDRSDAMLPKKFRDDHTFDPTTRVFEPTQLRAEHSADKLQTPELHQQVGALKPLESSRESAQPLSMPDRSLFGGSSGDSSQSLNTEKSPAKSLSSLFEPSRKGGSNENSLFSIILASFVYMIGAFFKMLAAVFFPRRAEQRARKFRRR